MGVGRGWIREVRLVFGVMVGAGRGWDCMYMPMMLQVSMTLFCSGVAMRKENRDGCDGCDEKKKSVPLRFGVPMGQLGVYRTLVFWSGLLIFGVPMGQLGI